MTELFILTLLFTKHFIVDFPLQVPYHYLNKGTYAHLGGIQHAMFHGIGTMIVSFFFAPTMWLWLGLLDAFLHYHIDWAKMNLNSKLGYGPLTSEKFWWLLGLDQYLHTLTYIGLTLIMM